MRDHPTASSDQFTLDREQREALRRVPAGAAALSAAAVLLLLVGWILIYLLIYIPRGTIG
jgi:hypothetical protein